MSVNNHSSYNITKNVQLYDVPNMGQYLIIHLHSSLIHLNPSYNPFYNPYTVYTATFEVIATQHCKHSFQYYTYYTTSTSMSSQCTVLQLWLNRRESMD